MECGFYRRQELSSDDYHGFLEAFSSTVVKEGRRSMAHVKARLDGERGQNKTPSLIVGNLIHVASLEAESLASEYVVKPEYSDADREAGVVYDDAVGLREACKSRGVVKPGTKKTDMAAALLKADPAVRLWSDVVEERCRDREVVSAADMDMALAIAANIKAHPMASSVLSKGVAEFSAIVRDEATGLLVKARADYLRRDLGLIVDLKSCTDARPDAVARDIWKYGYHISAAMYLDVFNQSEAQFAEVPVHYGAFAWIFVEKEPPYAVGLYYASDDMLARGMVEYSRYVRDIAECRKSGVWPAYAESFATIELPVWA